MIFILAPGADFPLRLLFLLSQLYPSTGKLEHDRKDAGQEQKTGVHIRKKATCASFSNLKESSKYPETGRECVLQGPRGSGATYAQLNLAGLGISCSSREKGEIQTGEAP